MKLLVLVMTPILMAQGAGSAMGMPPWVNNVTSLGALIFVVYWFTRAVDRRDIALGKQTEALVSAVRAFEAFEADERATHVALSTELQSHTIALAQITTTLAEIAITQRETVEMLGELRADLRRNHQDQRNAS